MANKIVAPPGTPDELIGICKVLLGKTGKRAFVWEGFTALIFPKKKLAIILVPGLGSYLFFNRERGDVWSQVVYEPWMTNVGEANAYTQPIYDTLPEELDDTYRLFGSTANGEPYLKTSGYTTHKASMNDTKFHDYWYKIKESLDDVSIDLDPTNAEVVQAERDYSDLIRSFIKRFDSYQYIMDYFPEDSKADAMLDWVADDIHVFPTYNGVPVYRGPTLSVAGGANFWPELIPLFCRKNNQGEYIIIFSMRVDRGFRYFETNNPNSQAKTDVDYRNDPDYTAPSASNMFLTNAEFSRLGLDSNGTYRGAPAFYKDYIANWNWVAYKAEDVLRHTDATTNYFELQYRSSTQDQWFHIRGNMLNVNFSFDSTVEDQDFIVRYKLPNADRLGLVQEDNRLLNAQILLGVGEFQEYHNARINPPSDKMLETPETGCYFPYDPQPQHQDYPIKGIYIQLQFAEVHQTAIEGGFNISGNVQFYEIMNPRDHRADNVAEWFFDLGDEAYTRRASACFYWEPYKFWDLGHHVGVGTLPNGQVMHENLQSRQDISGSRNAFSVLSARIGSVDETEVFDYGYGTTTTRTEEEIDWNHVQMMFQNPNRELHWLSQIAVIRKQSIRVVNDWTQGTGGSPGPYDVEEITTNTVDSKDLHNRYAKKFDFVGENLVVSNLDTETLDINFQPYSGASYNDSNPAVSPSGYVNQANLSVGAISYDIPYQAYADAPKQVGARISIPSSYINPQVGPGWAPGNLNDLHGTDAPWTVKVGPVNFTEGVFKDLRSGEVEGYPYDNVGNDAKMNVFRNVAGHTITSQDGDIYRDGQFLFRPTHTLIGTDGRVLRYTGIVGSPWNSSIDLYTGQALYIWGDSNTYVTSYSYTGTTKYDSGGPNYVYQVTERSGSGLTVSEKIPTRVLINYGNTIHTHALAPMRWDPAFGGDSLAASEFLFIRDPLQTESYTDYYNPVGRSEKLLFDQMICSAGIYVPHGWLPFYNHVIRAMYIRVDGGAQIGEDDDKHVVQLHISAWLDESGDLKLCFFRDSNNFHGPDPNGDHWTHPAWEYNEFMTPQSVNLYPVQDDPDIISRPDIWQSLKTPYDIITQEGLNELAAFTDQATFTRQFQTVSRNLKFFAVNKTEEEEDA